MACLILKRALKLIRGSEFNLSFLLDTFQILQITAIENEMNNRTVHALFVNFLGNQTRQFYGKR